MKRRFSRVFFLILGCAFFGGSLASAAPLIDEAADVWQRDIAYPGALMAVSEKVVPKITLDAVAAAFRKDLSINPMLTEAVKDVANRVIVDYAVSSFQHDLSVDPTLLNAARDVNARVMINYASSGFNREMTLPLHGDLQAFIQPGEVIDAGARWQKAGSGVWLESGHVIDGLQLGDYGVVFSPVAGWNTPESRIVQVTYGTVESTLGTYTENDSTYQISVAAATEGGAVDGADTYLHNQTVTLTAVPGHGYRFLYWTENGKEVSSDAEYTFLATRDVQVNAYFEEIPWWVPLPGDVNGDGVVDLADVLAGFQIAAGIYSGMINMGADVNGNGKIGMAEAVYGMETVAGER